VARKVQLKNMKDSLRHEEYKQQKEDDDEEEPDYL